MLRPHLETAQRGCQVVDKVEAWAGAALARHVQDERRGLVAAPAGVGDPVADAVALWVRRVGMVEWNLEVLCGQRLGWRGPQDAASVSAVARLGAHLGLHPARLGLQVPAPRAALALRLALWVVRAAHVAARAGATRTGLRQRLAGVAAQ